MFHGSLRDHRAALSTGLRPHFDQPIGLAENPRVMIDQKNGISIGDQIAHHSDQTIYIARMQSNGRLVQHIQYARCAVAYRTGQLHALALPGRPVSYTHLVTSDAELKAQIEQRMFDLVQARRTSTELFDAKLREFTSSAVVPIWHGTEAVSYTHLDVYKRQAYLVVGIAIPLVTSKLSGDDGMKFRTKSGNLSGFVLDSLRGLSETLQYGQGKKRLDEMNRKTDELAKDEERMKRTAGRRCV